MSSDPEYWRKKVLIGMLAHPDTETRVRIERLFHDNPEFYTGIKVLARALPEFVKIMADQAEEQEALRRTVEGVMVNPPPFTITPGA